MTFNWLLFDADGTLFDYDRAEGRALAATFAEVGLGDVLEITTIYREINAQMWRDFEQGLMTQEELRSARFAALLQKMGLPGDAEAISGLYLQNLGRATDLIDGALDVVRALEPYFRLALITNGIPEVQYDRLSRSPLGQYFPTVTISGEVGYAKPDPRIFDAAFAKMGLPEKELVLLIGDSLSADIRGGNDYGIATCWFNPQRAAATKQISPTYEICSLTELTTLLGLGA